MKSTLFFAHFVQLSFSCHHCVRARFMRICVCCCCCFLLLHSLYMYNSFYLQNVKGIFSEFSFSLVLIRYSLCAFLFSRPSSNIYFSLSLSSHSISFSSSSSFISYLFPELFASYVSFFTLSRNSVAEIFQLNKKGAQIMANHLEIIVCPKSV